MIARAQLLGFALASGLCACTSGEPAVSAAWVRAAPDGTALGAAYFTLANTGKAVELIAIESNAHGDARIHESFLQDEMMRMRSIERLPIAANSRIAFSPGGLHVMLMHPTRSLVEGDSIELTLTFSDGSIVKTVAPVSRTSP